MPTFQKSCADLVLTSHNDHFIVPSPVLDIIVLSFFFSHWIDKQWCVILTASLWSFMYMTFVTHSFAICTFHLVNCLLMFFPHSSIEVFMFLIIFLCVLDKFSVVIICYFSWKQFSSLITALSFIFAFFICACCF